MSRRPADQVVRTVAEPRTVRSATIAGQTTPSSMNWKGSYANARLVQAPRSVHASLPELRRVVSDVDKFQVVAICERYGIPAGITTNGEISVVRTINELAALEKSNLGPRT